MRRKFVVINIVYTFEYTNKQKQEIMNYKLLQEARWCVEKRWTEARIIKLVQMSANNEAEARIVLAKLYSGESYTY